MLSDGVVYYFITPDSKYYDQAVELRYKIFYEPSNVSMSGVFDALEDKSQHLVAVMDEKVIGYIRLTVEEESGQLSQFVIEPSMRGKRNIARDLFRIVVEKAKENQVHRLWGEIRLHVTQAAKIYGFNISEEVFPSKKTGIPHRKIEMYI